jgi:hypothetical protein
MQLQGSFACTPVLAQGGLDAHTVCRLIRPQPRETSGVPKNLPFSIEANSEFSSKPDGNETYHHSYYV